MLFDGVSLASEQQSESIARKLHLQENIKSFSLQISPFTVNRGSRAEPVNRTVVFWTGFKPVFGLTAHLYLAW